MGGLIAKGDLLQPNYRDVIWFYKKKYYSEKEVFQVMLEKYCVNNNSAGICNRVTLAVVIRQTLKSSDWFI